MTEPEHKTIDVWVVRESDGKVVEIKADEILRWDDGRSRAIMFYVNGDVVAQFFNEMSYYKKDSVYASDGHSKPFSPEGGELCAVSFSDALDKLNILRAATHHYCDNYLRDEFDYPELCCSDEHRAALLALRDALEAFKP